MKLSDLKLSEIRKIYYVEIEGNIEEVTVYNLFGEERQQLKDIITKEMGEDTTGKDFMNLKYEKAFNLATDIEIDDELIDSFYCDVRDIENKEVDVGLDFINHLSLAGEKVNRVKYNIEENPIDELNKI